MLLHEDLKSFRTESDVKSSNWYGILTMYVDLNFFFACCAKRLSQKFFLMNDDYIFDVKVLLS